MLILLHMLDFLIRDAVVVRRRVVVDEIEIHSWGCLDLRQVLLLCLILLELGIAYELVVLACSIFLIKEEGLLFLFLQPLNCLLCKQLLDFGLLGSVELVHIIIQVSFWLLCCSCCLLFLRGFVGFAFCWASCVIFEEIS